MPLDLVGEDPDSPEGCGPAVYVDPDSGDFYFQGLLVTDPLVLAKIGRHGPLHADEAVVRLPARMASSIAEAAACTYEPGRLGHGPADSTEVLKVAKHSTLHLEIRDACAPSHPTYQEFADRAGRGGTRGDDPPRPRDLRAAVGLHPVGAHAHVPERRGRGGRAVAAA
ncbi:hypothetical protein GCM10022416_63780 [Actinomadura keratinilytica]|uniref:Uncharacterized protein n=1 Tax=Actinomadura keratinilytica TaxID=547461 RepID=A0ABP6UJW2_9ACTN